MLALIHELSIIGKVPEGTGFDLPNGDRVSPAYAGWSNDAGYRLADILPAEDVPEGKRIVSTSVQMVGGTPQYVHEIEDIVISPDQVDAERDRRIDAGFSFGGKVYQTRPQDRENIAGAATAALAAIVGGAGPGDLRWHGGETDFAWIAADNSVNPMDAQTVFAFGQAAMAFKSALIFIGRSIKDMDPIPLDYADDAYWTV